MSDIEHLSLFFFFFLLQKNSMASLVNYCCNIFEQFTLSVLRRGKIPRHVGFILDGNRRFARRAGATSTKFGHYEGFKQLEKVKAKKSFVKLSRLMCIRRC